MTELVTPRRPATSSAQAEPDAAGRVVLVARWRTWAARHPVSAALLAGLTAVHVATVIGFWMGDFGLVRLDWNTANGHVYVPHASPLTQFLVGGGMHYADGVLFAVLFAALVHPVLPWSDARGGNVVKGVVFGSVLAIIALLVLTPLVYAPARGAHAGFFSSALGGKYILSVFIFHWVYGLHLGLVYNPVHNSEPLHSAVSNEPT